MTATSTDDREAIRADFLKTLDASIAAIENQLVSLECVRTGQTAVIELSEGLFLRQIGDGSTLTGIEHATRYSQEIADSIAPSVRDGNGLSGTVVDLRDALEREIKRSLDLAANIKSLEF